MSAPGRNAARGTVDRVASANDAGGGDGDTGDTGVALRARGLGVRYRRRWALAECTLDIPAGRVVGLAGPNGAGKSTLLTLAAGLRHPSAGSLTVLGGRPGSGTAQLAKVGFVAQDTRPTRA